MDCWTVPPVIRTKTADSTGYVIETVNCANVGPGGCVRMTTREFWRLSASTLSGGDIIPQVDRQTQPESPNVLNERRMCFGKNEPTPALRKCSYCTTPTAGSFPMGSFAMRSNSTEEIKHDTTTKRSKPVLNEDAACETNRPVLIHAESQTDFCNIETDSDPGNAVSETAISDSSNKSCSESNSESSNDERDLSQNVSSEDDIICQEDICPKCKAINAKKKCKVCSQTDLRRKRSNNKKCRACSGKEKNAKRNKAGRTKKKSHKKCW